MKISFPHMGNLAIALAGAMRVLGAEVVVPPYTSKRTLSIGTRNSPEAVCLPYKLLLGNYIEAIELGADAILMIDSPGICRLGQYSSGARNAIRDLGYDVEFINFDLYKGKFTEMYSKFKKLGGNVNPITILRAINIAVTKVSVMDKFDKAVCYYRAHEIKIGSADLRYKRAIKKIDEALTGKECRKALKFGLAEIKSTPIDKDRDVLHVDLTGEFFVVLDSFSNLEIEKELGKLGVHVHRKVNLSEWVNASLLPSFLRAESHGEKAQRFAKTYIKRDIGGDAIESIGDAVSSAADNRDGVIHLLPFTCMPEIISQNILPNIRNDNDVAILSLVLDEQMGKAGFVTRLEAFVDLLRRRKMRKPKEKNLLSLC